MIDVATDDDTSWTTVPEGLTAPFSAMGVPFHPFRQMVIAAAPVLSLVAVRPTVVPTGTEVDDAEIDDP